MHLLSGLFMAVFLLCVDVLYCQCNYYLGGKFLSDFLLFDKRFHVLVCISKPSAKQTEALSLCFKLIAAVIRSVG